MLNFGGTVKNIGLNKLNYSFYFDGKQINLFNASDSKSAYMMYGPQNIDIIQGVSSKGNCCCFYRNRMYSEFMSKDATVTTNAFFLRNNTFDRLYSFDTMTFYGDVINKCFPPSQAVSYDSFNINHNPNFSNIKDGSKTIKLNSFKERTKEFEINYKNNKIKLKFSIATPGTISENDTNLGSLTSFFQIIFNESQSIEKIHEWYLIVKKLFQFLLGVQEIAFEEVKVGVLNENNLNSNVGEYNNLVDKVTEQMPNSAKFELYIKNFENLFSLLLNENINMNHIAKNSYDLKYVDSEKYISCSASFEYNYNKYLKLESKNINDREIVVSTIQNYINTESVKLSSNQKRFIKKVINPELYKLIDNTADKYNRALKHFNSVLIDIIESYSKTYNFYKWGNLGEHFASTRNKRAHGELEQFSNEAVLAYEIGKILIDCIILQKSNFTYNEIKEIVNKKYL